MSHELHLQHVAHIADAKVEFGDLTVLVGPQATGKSILLQFHKLLVDIGCVLAEMKRYGLDWGKNLNEFLDSYFGEGMRGIWRQDDSTITVRGEPIDLHKLIGRQKRYKDETLFFIPAQRVLTLGKGWPRPFTDYSPGDPFVVRDFSEKLRLLMESELAQGEALFPQTRRLKSEIRELLKRTVFADFGLRVDKHGAQKRLVLSQEDGETPFPYMVWSAGQREFVPLLLGLYWLLPPTKVSRRAEIEWVVIEELEMGLHPQAISAVLLLVLELLSRGYRVCLSTHSPHVLDVVWAMQTLRRHRANPVKLLEVFDVEGTPSMRKMAERVLAKEARVYYFDRTTRRTHEISNLDPGAADAAEAGWGGLTEFSGRVQDVVASVMMNQERERE
jgi:hypothetical protein